MCGMGSGSSIASGNSKMSPTSHSVTTLDTQCEETSSTKDKIRRYLELAEENRRETLKFIKGLQKQRYDLLLENSFFVESWLEKENISLKTDLEFSGSDSSYSDSDVESDESCSDGNVDSVGIADNVDDVDNVDSENMNDVTVVDVLPAISEENDNELAENSRKAEANGKQAEQSEDCERENTGPKQKREPENELEKKEIENNAKAESCGSEASKKRRHRKKKRKKSELKRLLTAIAEEEARLKLMLGRMTIDVERLKKKLEKEQQSEKRNRSREQQKTANTQGTKKSGAESKQSNYSTGDSQSGRNHKKEYFQEELKRLRGSLEREGSKIQKPQRKAYTPYTFTTLEPYYNTVTQSKVIEHVPKEPKGYVPRKTAIGLCDPWLDHEMDVTLLPKPEEKDEPTSPRHDEKGQARPKKSKHKVGGSTRLPKFPAVQMPTGDLATKPLNYGDVPLLRQELKTKYGSSSDKKVNEEYERTKDDFYRMDLDKLEEYHPISRGHMTQAYMAYLQNNPGSKKAIKECIESAEKDLEETIAASRPTSAVSRHSQRPASSRSRRSVQQE